MSRETEAGLLAVENEALRAEIERLRLDLANEKAAIDSACSTVAAMHAAAMGRVCGPRLGVVEDVAALRAALLGILAITDRKHVAWEAAHAALGDEPRCIHESWDMTPSPGVTAMHARCFRCGMVWNGEWRQPTQPEGEP